MAAQVATSNRRHSFAPQRAAMKILGENIWSKWIQMWQAPDALCLTPFMGCDCSAVDAPVRIQANR